MRMRSISLSRAAGFVADIAVVIMFAISIAATGVTRADDFFVATDGSDTNPGTLERPFASIERAQAKVRQDSSRGKQPITVYLREGTYYLKQPLVFTHEDSGGPGAPVTYAAYKSEKVVVSGGGALDLSWRHFRDGILQADTPPGLVFDQLFVNGKRQRMARYPNYDPHVSPYNGFSADAFSSKRAARWADPAGGFIHAMHKHHWGGYHYLITGKQSDHTVTYEGGWQNNRQMGMHPDYRYVENIFEELDAAGEWFHDRKANVLYYFPTDGMDVEKCTFEVAQLKHLVEFEGSQEQPVQFINLLGLTFRHTTRTFMETKEPLLRSDWTVYRGGAVTFSGAEDCTIADCEFDQVGGNAVFGSNFNRRIAVRGAHIHGAGASGVSFVGNPASVRNLLFEYQQTQSYSEIDQTPGPKGEDFPSECVVEDSLIHHIGVVEKQAAGVQISMSSGITLRHCSIYDVGRAGINISEGTFGGHLIEFCDVFDTVRETGDHGSFNSWGRDRFWNLKDAPADELPELASLDAKPTVIRNSRWRCDRGWDVDLDDGSSNYEIYNNLFLHGGLKLREGFHRHVYNNIAVNNSLHPHVWYKNSGDVVTGNIWMTQYRPVQITKWGKEVDRNLFVAEADRQAFAADGCDLHSVVGDPMFVDPTHGDYRVQPGSPALQIGFKNFPMDQFGVQKPELKAIARVPAFPTPELKSKAPSDTQVHVTNWWGAAVSALSGEEYSAFGVSQEDGGIHLISVPPDSEAAQAGLLAGDVIQRSNKKATRTIAQLLGATKRGRGKAITLQLVRKQQELSLTTERAPAESAHAQTRDQRMNWWREAKFGMFIHWGVYSVPAGIYQGKEVVARSNALGEWIMRNAEIPVDEYRGYARQFNPVKYNPEEWAALAKRAGMRYVVITAKHHDGFAMYDSDASNWDIVDASPYGKDVIAPLASAVRDQGLKFGLYYSQAQDWVHPGGGKAELDEGGGWDEKHKGNFDEYLRQIAVPQTRELLTRFRPDILWWDTPCWMNRKRAEPLHALLALQPDVITNNRLGGGVKGDTETPEQHIPDTGFKDRDWETCMTMNGTWGYKSCDHDWKSTDKLIEMLIEVVSKGGNFLLNVGPMADGTIPKESVERLQEVGQWLDVNGESIYGASASPISKPAWGRVTYKPRDGLIYLHVIEWPTDGRLSVADLPGRVSSAKLLGVNLDLAVSQENGSTSIQLPAADGDELPKVIRLKLAGDEFRQ